MKVGSKMKGIEGRHKAYIKKIHFPVIAAVILLTIGIGAAFGTKFNSSGLPAWFYNMGNLPVLAAPGNGSVGEDSVLGDVSAAEGDSVTEDDFTVKEDSVTEGDSAVLGDSNLNMTVDYGYDKYVKYGRYMNVTASITNNGKDFKGWFQVIVPKTQNNVLYRTEVTVASRSSSEISIVVPIMDDTGFMQVKLVDKDGDTILEKKYELKIGNYEKLAYVGILSEEKEKLDYIESFGTRIFYLDESTLSGDYRALDLLDIIIINHFDTSRLKDEQINAIQRWVMDGGTLVIGTGEYSEGTLAKLGGVYSIKDGEGGVTDDLNFGMDRESLQELKQDMIDYEEERKIFLEMLKGRNEMLKAYGNNTIPINNTVFQRWTKTEIEQLQPEVINKYISDVTMKSSSVIVSEGSHKLMQAAVSGLGKVQLFSFDLGLGENNRTAGLAILNEIRKNISNSGQTRLDEEYYGLYTNYGIYNSMSYTDAKNIPKVGRYIIILSIYICIIGPFTFILLKRLDKRSLTWAAVPVTAVLFTLLVYFIGSDTRIKEPYVGYVKLLDFQEGGKVNEEFYFSLTAPNNHNYSVPVEGNYNIVELRNSGDNSYLYDYKKEKKAYYDNYITTINYGVQDTVLKVKDNPAFSPVYYQFEDTYDMEAGLTSDIHYVGEKIYGTVTNGFNFDLTNAMLTSDGYVINLGEIKKGETVSLEGKDTIFMTTRDELYGTDIINKIAGGTGDLKDNTVQINRLTNVLYNLTENNLIKDQHGSCIIGFVEELSGNWENRQSLFSELIGNMKAYGTTVLKLPVEVDYISENKVFVPSIDPYIMLDGYYDKYYESRYLGSESMTVKYHLPDGDKILSFEYLSSRNQGSSSEYVSSFDGSIHFLNVKTGKYEKVFKEGPGSSTGNADNYLTEQNTITVRYSTEMSLKGYQMMLPYISYWKEADTDASD